MEKSIKKIGFNGRPFCQDGLRGLGRHTLELIINLKKINPELEIYIYTYDKISSYYKNLMPFAHFQDEKIRPKMVWDLYYLPKKIREDNIDIFHSTNNLGIPFFVDIPCFTTIHDCFTHEERVSWGYSLKKLWSAINYKLEQFIYLKSHAFFTVSESAKIEIHQKLGIPMDKIFVAYNGTSLVSEKDAESGEEYFLYVGGLEARKNINILLEAVLSFNKNSKINFKLKMVGSIDSASSDIRKTIENNSSIIQFLGHQTDTDLVKLYQGSKCLIFPSLKEGFGLPLIEALSLGVPVIASNIPVFREIGNRGVIYFNPESAIDLESKILELIGSKVLKENAKKEAKEIADQYTWEKMARKIYSTYMKF